MRSTVRTATLELMRALDMRTVFGNPGSTELAFLADWPSDFSYVLGLQESVVVGMADGYAQATGQAAFVNLHSAAGVGHAMGAIFTAYKNQTPLVITAGQQERSLLPFLPFLGAHQASEFPQPYVKWAVEPARPEDVPRAVAQAWRIAMQAPSGPTFISIPSDDWTKPAEPVELHEGYHTIGPDPNSLQKLINALNNAKHPAIVFGPGVGRENAQEDLKTIAERLAADVWAAPMISRDGLRQDHPLFAGFLPAASGPIKDLLSKYDCILVLGGAAFLLHIADDLASLRNLPPVYQICDDPFCAAMSGCAVSLVSSLSAILPVVGDKLERRHPRGPTTKASSTSACSNELSAETALNSMAALAPASAIFVEEAPSHKKAIQKYLPVVGDQNFYAMASGGLGFGMAAAIGISMANRNRRVIAIIGDGSAMYSIQALWTAVKHNLNITYVVLNNRGYGAMRAFSDLRRLGNIPGIDVSGICFTDLARSLGCGAAMPVGLCAFEQALKGALTEQGPKLIEVILDREAGPLF